MLIAVNRFYVVGFRAIRMKSPNMDSLDSYGNDGSSHIQPLFHMADISGQHGSVEGLYFETAGVIITLILPG